MRPSQTPSPCYSAQIVKRAVAILSCSFSAFAFACAGTPAPDALGSCPGELRTHADLEASDDVSGDATRGADLFALECSKCHSRHVVERTSRLFRGYPRLDCRGFHAKVTDAYLRRVISLGGTAVGLDKAMKPFAEKLSDQQINDLVAYVRGLAP